MGSGLLNVTNVASAGGSPAQYTLTCADTTGVTANDHLGGELSNGTDAIYKILSVGSSTSLTIEDSLTEGNGGSAFGQPATGTQLGYATPNTVLGLSKLPEGSKGWRALVERNNAILDAAEARKIRETSGPTSLTVGAVANGEYLVRSGSTIVGATGSTPAHKDTHKSGGGDAFTSTDVLEAVVKRILESGGPTTLTVGSIADGETVKRSGANLIGYTPAAGTVILSTAQGRLGVSSSDSVGTGSGTTLYYLPHEGNQIALYDGSSAWAYHNFGTGLSFDLSSDLDLDGASIASSSVYDAFVWDDSGTKKLALKKWTSATARATSIVEQDGVDVLSGATDKRWVGTIRTSSSTAVHAAANRWYVWNRYNRVSYSVTTGKSSPTSYVTGTSGTWRTLNGADYDEFSHKFVNGEVQRRSAEFGCIASYSAGGALYMAVRLDGAAPSSANLGQAYVTGNGILVRVKRDEQVAIGYHEFNAYDNDNGTATVFLADWGQFVLEGEW